MLPETSAFVKHFEGQTKRMYFMIEDDDLFEKCSTIWDKVGADVKNNLIASISTIIFGNQNKISCLNAALMKDENYYLQVFLKECKYIKKKVRLLLVYPSLIKRVMLYYEKCVFKASGGLLFCLFIHCPTSQRNRGAAFYFIPIIN